MLRETSCQNTLTGSVVLRNRKGAVINHLISEKSSGGQFDRSGPRSEVAFATKAGCNLGPSCKDRLVRDLFCAVSFTGSKWTCVCVCVRLCLNVHFSVKAL
jgi:hypothetical protein